MKTSLLNAASERRHEESLEELETDDFNRKEVRTTNRTKVEVECVGGCGRRSRVEIKVGKRKPDYLCYYCKSGRQPLLPRVELLPNDYLLTCVAELRKRHKRFADALNGLNNVSGEESNGAAKSGDNGETG